MPRRRSTRKGYSKKRRSFKSKSGGYKRGAPREQVLRIVMEAPSPAVTTPQLLADRFKPLAPRKAQF